MAVMEACPLGTNYNTAVAAEIFERSMRYLLEQGRPSIKRTKDDGMNGVMCSYRGEGGAKCAAGFFIPDSQYQSTMEGKSIEGVAFFDHYSLSERVGLRFAQFVHDHCATNGDVSSFVQRLSVMAGKTLAAIKAGADFYAFKSSTLYSIGGFIGTWLPVKPAPAHKTVLKAKATFALPATPVPAVEVPAVVQEVQTQSHPTTSHSEYGSAADTVSVLLASLAGKQPTSVADPCDQTLALEETC